MCVCVVRVMRVVRVVCGVCVWCVCVCGGHKRGRVYTYMKEGMWRGRDMGEMSVTGVHEGSTHVCEAIVLLKNTQGIQGIYESRFEHSR